MLWFLFAFLFINATPAGKYANRFLYRFRVGRANGLITGARAQPRELREHLTRQQRELLSVTEIMKGKG